MKLATKIVVFKFLFCFDSCERELDFVYIEKYTC